MKVRMKPHERRLVLGITGSGKSQHVKTCIVRRTPRVLTWDPHAEYANACDLDEVSLEELAEEPELLARAEVRLSVVPEWLDVDELCEQFRTFVRVLKEHAPPEDDPKAPVTLLVVEEVGLLRPNADGAVIALATQARHWRMPLVLVAQQATGIPPRARSQASSIVSFRQQEASDLTALAERIGAAKAERVGRLRRYKCVAWDESESFS